MINSFAKYLVVGGGSLALLSVIASSNARVSPYSHAYYSSENNSTYAADTPTPDKPKLKYNIPENNSNNPIEKTNEGGLLLKEPANIETNVEYDPVSGKYIVTKKMGNIDYSPPTYMTSEEYQDYMFRKQVKDYWSARTHADSKNPPAANPALPKLKVGGEVFDRIFGGNNVSIQPNGSAELILGVSITKTDNPAIPERNRKIPSMNFDQKIQLNVIGKIGDKLKISTSYNTEATFDFENQMKLDYTGYDDEILRKIEAGNVSFQSNNSLISGSQTLLGVKTQMQFGRLSVTSVMSQERGKTSEVEVAGGSQTSTFNISADNYDPNRHFFLGHYFRDKYDEALAKLPFVNSQVNITRIEVWVTNVNTATTDIRGVLAFAELGEDAKHIPVDQQGFIQDISSLAVADNTQNNLYEKIKNTTETREASTAINALNTLSSSAMKNQTNYELIASARKLTPSEYTYHPQLGYISLKQQLTPAQALCVAYQYTENGVVYQVGEFSDGGISAPQLLHTKMLKSTFPNPKHPMWDLMMKNIYAIGAYQIKQQDFRLDVFYLNRQTGTDINYLPVSKCQTNINGRPLIQVLNVDRLNQQNEIMADGGFDYIEGVTVISNSGLIVFPVIEPFGQHLKSKFIAGCSENEADSYAFPQLYDSTKVIAQQYFPQLNRFKLKGRYQSSSSSEINLGSPNIAKGSVIVTAGGVTLTENVDYTVDYTLGRVKVINEGILNSGTPVKVKSGSNALFNMQQKRLIASRFDYKVNRDFVVGGTIMNLTERPMNNKVNIGYEPISNTIVGLDANYKTEAPFLTRMVDKLPFYSTKAPSFLNASGEFAYLIPGHNKAIGKTGNSYVDDFEATQSTIDLKSQNAWVLASVPQGQLNLFPEGGLNNNIASGYNRAKLAWYSISQELLRQTDNITPRNITNEDLSNNFNREVLETEIFPSKQLPNGVPSNIPVFDLAYYPSEIGPYNFDTKPSNVSAGLNADGTLNKPETRWAGIMRSLPTTDFQSTNVEYIQFWVMDPFNEDNPQSNWNNTGELYFNLGNVSEDILNDGQRSAENGLPTPVTAGNTITTTWGQVPAVQPLLATFNANDSERPYQDVGYDGLASSLSLNSGATEETFYSDYLNNVQNVVSGSVLSAFKTDPAHDDFQYFRSTNFDDQNTKILERYKNFNNPENNSRTSNQSEESYPTAANQTPNIEDLDRDNNMNTAENYFQYRISLKPSDFDAGVGKNYITNVFTTNGANIKDGTTKPIKWYQFKIPVKSPEKVVGGIDNFQSIRFMRMFIKGADKPIVLRFARLELVRSEWRKYDSNLKQPGLYQPDDYDNTIFDVAAVNLEENGGKQPVNYILPPDITRQVAYGTTNVIQLNEQALSLNTCNLKDGDSRAAFKNISLDVRNYRKLEMFIHGEAPPSSISPLKDNDLNVFVRLGTDNIENYYEYEIPLKLTAPGFYNGENINDQYAVWPEANKMVLEFSKLQEAKQQRNLSLGSTTQQVYVVFDGSRKITIKGNPNLSDVKTVMIGVRNPRKTGGNELDDGLPKCAEIWVNELRLTDFINNGGGAANANVMAQLADLGSVSVSGSMYTPGFGSIENKVSERKREDFRQYNLTSSIELGKFLPKNANINIPMYAGYSETFITPQFDPLAPDLILKEELKTLPKPRRDSLRKIVVDYTERKNIAFSNVRKTKGKNATKQHIYDIENWSTSYSFSQVVKRTINTDYDTTRNYKAGLTYAYSPTPKNIRPFAKTKFLQKKQLSLIRDINFYPYPNQLGFSTDVIRDFNKNKYRDVTAGEIKIEPTFNKKITWNRNYLLGYAITKDLKVDYNANNEARILEPYGDINTQAKRDSIVDGFKQLGKTTQFNSQFNANYNIPVNKLPYLDFTKAQVKYSGSYNWKRAPFNADSLGNTIQNSQVINWGGDINFTAIYNKSAYLRRVMSRGLKPTAPPPKNPKDSIKRVKKDPMAPLDYLMKIIISPRNLNASYAINNGTILPGYKQPTYLIGLDSSFRGPTTGFIFGSQKDIRSTAIENDWLVKNPQLNTPYTKTHGTTLNIRSNLEPFPNMKIELNAMQSKTNSLNEIFRWSDQKGRYDTLSPVRTGNFSMSFLSVSTSFANGDKIFENFLNEREKISARQGNANPNSINNIDGYSEGYNQTSQDVLIPAFIAAYSGKGSSKVGLTEFPNIPKPNWRITYDGLSKIPKVKKYFKNLTLSHAYKSTYSVGGYTSNLLYTTDADGNAIAKQTESSIPSNPNFYSKNLITTVSIIEQWSPLMKFDITLHNSMLVNLEFRRDRNLSLGITSKAITEILGREVIIGTGYKFKDLKLGKNVKIAGKPVKSDLNLIGNISIRRNETVIRRIEERNNQITAGTNIISLKLSADYAISDKLTIRLFYDRILNRPLISNSFPTTNTNAGISLRLTLSG